MSLVASVLPSLAQGPQSCPYPEPATECAPKGHESVTWAYIDNMAIVMAMTSAAEHLPLADVKNRLSEVVERLEREHGRVVITKHGRPAAVVLSIEDLEGLEETLEILSDKPLMRRLRKSQAEVEAGAATELSKDEALALVRGRR